jgi:trehalose 6-phosphate synthase/phosphatase
VRRAPAELLAALAAALRAAPGLVLLLDYDGTLVPFAPRPEEAAPDAELLALLAGLARRPRTALHLVSGRPRDTLEAWFGHLPAGLHAEHGLWSRPGAGRPWIARPAGDLGWRPAARQACRAAAASLPGSFVEDKPAGLAWHYRTAEPRAAAAAAAALEARLRALLAGAAVELLRGDHVLELRPAGVHKGLLVEEVRAQAPPDSLLLAIGDDRTDEDLFAALPPGAVAIHVGPRPSAAPLRLDDVGQVRALLASLLDAPGPAGTGLSG